MPAESARKTLILGGDPLMRSQLMDALAGAATPVDLDAGRISQTESAAADVEALAKDQAGATALIYCSRAYAAGEPIDAYLEEVALGFLFTLKLAHALRGSERVDVIAAIGAPSAVEDSDFATSMAQGTLRQMVKVATAEWGPLEPPVAVNGLILEDSEQPALAAPLERLIGQSEGYIDGVIFRIGRAR